MSHFRAGAIGAVLVLGTLVYETPAAAHISLERAGTHLSRYGDSEIKDAPCGRAGGERGANVYTYEAGETIEVRLNEYIPHPGYFRFAFDDDGDDDFVDPVSIKPIDPNRACPYNAADQCGESDFYNNDTVLPGMDSLDPHVTAMFGQEYSWNVTLPDVACDNCTLQIIQVMEDVVHGAYNTVRGDPNDQPYIEDVYHQCIDLVLEKDATDTEADAGDGEPREPDSESRRDDDGGCTVTTGTPAPRSAWPAALLGLSVTAGIRRRRRAARSR